MPDGTSSKEACAAPVCNVSSQDSGATRQFRYNHVSVATFSATPHPELNEASRAAVTRSHSELFVTAAQQTRARASVSARAMTYCCVLLLLPVLGIPLGVMLGSSDFFLRHGASVWVRSNDAVFDMQGRNCEVVIFGDSTAMTGVDPALVTERTGLRTCNIAVTNAVLAVTDNMTLDHYLAHNARPRAIVVQLSPDGFLQQNQSWRSTIYPEGLLEQLRHGASSESRKMLLSHPQETIAFAGYAAGFTAYDGIKQAWFHLTGLRPEEDTIVVRNGFFTPPAPARTHCDPVASVSDPTHGAFARSIVQHYREHFAGQADAVMVDVAPIPSCDDNLSAFRAELNGVTSNPMLALPISLFNDERHFTSVGSTIVSRMVADELNQSPLATGSPRTRESSPVAALDRTPKR